MNRPLCEAFFFMGIMFALLWLLVWKLGPAEFWDYEGNYVIDGRMKEKTSQIANSESDSQDEKIK